MSPPLNASALEVMSYSPFNLSGLWQLMQVVSRIGWMCLAKLIRGFCSSVTPSGHTAPSVIHALITSVCAFVSGGPSLLGGITSSSSAGSTMLR